MENITTFSQKSNNQIQLSPEKKKKTFSRQTKRLMFYIGLISIPLFLFGLFYVYVNFNSFVLAFQKYENGESGYVISFAAFDNFKKAWETITTETYLLKNSLILYACNLCIGLFLSIIFSYYIYKKFFLSGTFRVILFLPSIISSLVLATLFRYVVNQAYPAVVLSLTGEKVKGLISNLDTRFVTVIFYNIWISFGVHTLMFTNAMGGINESIVEAVQLDGANIVQEFVYITVPMIFPTITSFLVAGLAQMFMNQMDLYAFFTLDAGNMSTVGYFLFVQTKRSNLVGVDNCLTYPQLSALGLILTCFITPMVLTVKYLLEKYGPSAE